jgi:hypothetical protein
MWYECLPSMAAMMVGFAIMDIGPGVKTYFWLLFLYYFLLNNNYFGFHSKSQLIKLIIELILIYKQLCHWLSWGTPKMRYCWDEPSDQWTRRDQRIADTVLRMRWAANHHYTIGLDAIPDEDQPQTRFQDYRNYKPN